jgi:hypothetical protein
MYTVKETGRKPDRKPYPLPYGLRNPYRNLKSEYSQDYAQKPQQNCTFMNSTSGGGERGDRATGREREIERDTVEEYSGY